MFKNFSEKLNNALKSLKGKAVIKEDDIKQALREVRIALLEADVALSVIKEFTEKIRQNALGKEVIASVNPAQQVIKIVQDCLEEILGAETAELELSAKPPIFIMSVGLQGSGKTTSSAKLANFLTKKQKKRVLLASTDIYRPAAKEQLEILAKQIEVESLEIIAKEKPVKTAKRAKKKAEKEGFDIVILDTAGRLQIDKEMMKELKELEKEVKPKEILFVADSLMGQDAVNVAQSFKESLPLTGAILTRMDADARGGAALSIKTATKVPIKFVGLGEKIDAFDKFHPKRVASRILDMGDVVSLVEKAQEVITDKEAKDLESKMRKGEFTMDDLKSQMEKITQMGGFSSILNMLPGMTKMKDAVSQMGDKSHIIKQQIAIINSMTKKERRFPKVINNSRKIRIAKGSGTEPAMVNKLIKQHGQMQKMMKKLGKMDKKALMRGGMDGLMKGFQ